MLKTIQKYKNKNIQTKQTTIVEILIADGLMMTIEKKKRNRMFQVQLESLRFSLKSGIEA